MGEYGDQVVEYLRESVGEDKAREAVTSQARELGLLMPLSREHALLVLAAMGQEEGLLGVAARFAKSRLHHMP